MQLHHLDVTVDRGDRLLHRAARRVQTSAFSATATSTPARSSSGGRTAACRWTCGWTRGTAVGPGPAGQHGGRPRSLRRRPDRGGLRHRDDLRRGGRRRRLCRRGHRAAASTSRSRPCTRPQPRCPMSTSPSRRRVVGTNTVACMQSGIFWGYVGLIREICDRIRAERERPMTVVATGGPGAALPGGRAPLRPSQGRPDHARPHGRPPIQRGAPMSGERLIYLPLGGGRRGGA